MDHGRWTMDEAPWTMDEAPWTMDHGPWTMDEAPWTMPHGPGYPSSVHHSRWSRLIARCWAVWFVAILAQPAPLMSWLMRATMHSPVTAAAGTGTGDDAMPGMPDMARLSDGSGPHQDTATH